MQRTRRDIILAALLAATATSASANPIITTYYYMRGATMAITVALFVVAVESWIAGRMARITVRSALVPVALANLLSMVALTPPLLMAEDWFISSVATNQYHEQEFYPLFRTSEFVGLFLMTCVIEVTVVAGWRRLRRNSLPPARLALGVIAANVVTYGLLAPLAYWLDQPPGGQGLTWTPSSAWAAQPATRIISFDKEHRLRIVDSSGRNAEVLIRTPASGYMATGDLSTIVFTPEHFHNHLYRLDKKSGTYSLLPDVLETGNLGNYIGNFAMSPSGQRLAKLVDSDHGKELRLYDLALNKELNIPDSKVRVPRGDDVFCSIVWSRSDDILLMRKTNHAEHTSQSLAIKLSSDADAEVADLPTSTPLMKWTGYGPITYATGVWWAVPGDDRLTADSRDGTKLVFTRGRSSAFDLSRMIVTPLRDDNPKPVDGFEMSRVEIWRDGVRILAYDTRRPLRGGEILRGGNEIVLTDGHFMYLLDIALRRIGTIARGGNSMVFIEPDAESNPPPHRARRYSRN